MGGSAHVWRATLNGDVTAGSLLELQLVFTKWLDPAVSIGWFVGVEPAGSG